MEIRITTQQILNVLLVISWIIFVGLLVEAGAILCTTIYTLAYQPTDIGLLMYGANLGNLYQYDHGHFLVVTFFMAITAIMKALLFFLIVKILQGKKLDMSQPFSETLGKFIFSMAYLSIGIGIFSSWGIRYAKWLITQGVNIPNVEYLGLGGGDVWLFMAVILFVIGQIFKRGIEIQAEHELTV